MIKQSIIFVLILAFLASCGVYSFTGANIPAGTNTISIQTFYDEVGSGPPNLSQLFTEKIRDYLYELPEVKGIALLAICGEGQNQ